MGLAILLVDDDLGFADSLKGFLRKEGHTVEHAASGVKGVEMFRERMPDLVLLDLVLPDMDGLGTLEQLKQLDDSATVMVMTAHGSIATAVDAMRLGATDYLIKPIDLEALCFKLTKAAHVLGMRSDLGYLLDRERRGGDFEGFVGTCPAMLLLYDRIRDVAKTDNTTVLITGPTGAGKEVAAQAIHNLSARRQKPLMQIDCTSIPLTLLESELFGHERGAFTGADRVKKGLFELADQGTLLLDEIGDMDLTLQGKLLRVLQERQFRRVGGTRDLRVDVRVIAATNQDLVRMSGEGRFRRDLLYRLSVFRIELPPLSERGNDVLELAESFLRSYAKSFRKLIRGFDAAAREALLAYSFPGNVRELRNVIEQAVILAKSDSIGRELLPDLWCAAAPRSPDSPSSPQALSLSALGATPLEAAERELIRQALAQSGGNKTEAAELLGISRFSLQRKLEKLSLDLLPHVKAHG